MAKPHIIQQVGFERYLPTQQGGTRGVGRAVWWCAFGSKANGIGKTPIEAYDDCVRQTVSAVVKSVFG